MSKIKKYCEGLDCAICDEKEPCIYKIANDLQEQLKHKEQECEKLKDKYKNVCKVCPKNIKCNECSVKDSLEILKGSI